MAAIRCACSASCRAMPNRFVCSISMSTRMHATWSTTRNWHTGTSFPVVSWRASRRCSTCPTLRWPTHWASPRNSIQRMCTISPWWALGPCSDSLPQFYGASEGLDTIVIESLAPGGRAGTSSKIENYLGFPTGDIGCRTLPDARRCKARSLAPIWPSRAR